MRRGPPPGAGGAQHLRARKSCACAASAFCSVTPASKREHCFQRAGAASGGLLRATVGFHRTLSTAAVGVMGPEALIGGRA